MKQESAGSQHVFLTKMTSQEKIIAEAVQKFPVIYDKYDKHFKDKPPVYNRLLVLCMVDAISFLFLKNLSNTRPTSMSCFSLFPSLSATF